MKDKETIKVYMMTHGPECEVIPNYVTPMELGADLRTEFKYELKDNSTKDNISYKNKDYCELTGLYWMWKNDKHDITGLYHYRRMFLLSEKKIKKILKKYDVIVHKTVVKNIRNYFIKYIPSGSMDIFCDLLKEKYPEYYDAAINYLSSDNYIACQLFITNKAWFNGYCSWLFPLLEELEKIIPDEKKDNRYIGYIGELCLGIYITMNNNKYYGINAYFTTQSTSKFKSSKFFCSHFGHKIKIIIKKIINCMQ